MSEIISLEELDLLAIGVCAERERCLLTYDLLQENIGAMQITGVGSRRVVQLGAIVAIIFGLIGSVLSLPQFFAHQTSYARPQM